MATTMIGMLLIVCIFPGVTGMVLSLCGMTCGVVCPVRVRFSVGIVSGGMEEVAMPGCAGGVGITSIRVVGGRVSARMVVVRVPGVFVSVPLFVMGRYVQCEKGESQDGFHRSVRLRYLRRGAGSFIRATHEIS